MKHQSYRWLLCFFTAVGVVGLTWRLTQWHWEQPAYAQESHDPALPELPNEFPAVDFETTDFKIQTSDGLLETTIDQRMQAHLRQFVLNKSSPVAALVAVEVATGNILAFVQGRKPESWGSKVHSALYAGFPAASLFKSVVAAGAFEVGGMSPDDTFSLWGGCADVNRRGVWMREDISGKRYQMSIRKGYGRSCNGFFAKLAVNYLGLHAVTHFAHQLGWEKPIPADFKTLPSPLSNPDVRGSSAHAAGRYAAGFGYVGTSAVHAAWRMLTIARDGEAIPLRLFKRTTPIATVDPTTGVAVPAKPEGFPRVISAATASSLRSMMSATVQGGTSSYAFRRGKHRRLRGDVGGKTGTLSGNAPKGVNTWFSGMMPLEEPKIVVAAIVVLSDLWHIKGPNLAAEAFWAYDDLHRTQSSLIRKYGGQPLQQAHAKKPKDEI